MQVNNIDPTSPAKSLVQGSIFSLDGLSFTYDGKGHSFTEFYPSVSSEGVRHGIVMSQSCDLEREGPGRKVGIPYITVGLLEPFHRHIRRGEDWSKVAIPWTMKDENGDDARHTAICSDKVTGVLSKGLSTLIQNNAKCYFFVSFDSASSDERYYVLDLTKAFPVRARHYDEILRQVSHELKYEFARKLSWKMAELYGRADTADYPPDKAGTVVDELIALTDKALKISHPLELDKSEFQQAEKHRDSSPEEKARFLFTLMKARRAKTAQQAKQGLKGPS